MSLSVPAASWRQWAREAAASGAPLVLRGVGVGGLPETAKRIGERLGGADAGVAIDPRLFRLFGIERVPAVVVVLGGGGAFPRTGAFPRAALPEPGLRRRPGAAARRRDRKHRPRGGARSRRRRGSRRTGRCPPPPRTLAGRGPAMTEQNELSRDRIEVALDRGTRVVRLLTWTAMFVLVCLMLWVVSGMAAKAEEDPKAAARAIGNAGNAAARTIARDSSNAAEVPGYAGTNLPERGIGANALESEGRARLADPDDPGGAAGRAVVRGTTSRPPATVPASDPMVARSETIAASPQSAAHGAAGLASGSTADCGADLQDAQDGGSCGSVRYCVGAGCETVPSQVEHRIRERDDAAQHGGGAGRRRVRPRRHALLHRPAPRLPHQAVRARQLLQELRPAHRARQLLGVRARAGGGAQRRQHPLSRALLLEAHLLRRLRPPLAGLVRVRLQARAHPAAAGPGAARHRLVELPGLHRRGGREHRLRRASTSPSSPRT